MNFADTLALHVVSAPPLVGFAGALERPGVDLARARQTREVRCGCPAGGAGRFGGRLLCRVVLVVWWWLDSASAFELTVSGALVRSPTRVSNEVFATLTLPLDEWFAPTRALSRLSRHDATLRQAWNGAEILEERARGAAPALTQSGSEAVPTPDHAVQQSRLPKTTGERTAGWVPRVDAVFLQGLMAACGREFRVSRVELSDLASRARSSAWLPELQVKGGRNTDETLRLTPTEAEPDRYQLVGGDGVRFEGQIKWSFNQLVFARDELAVARLQGALETEKRRREHHAMDVLGKWLRSWVVLGDGSQPMEERVDAWIEERALRAQLDWLSQGWFSRHVKPAAELPELGAAEAS